MVMVMSCSLCGAVLGGLRDVGWTLGRTASRGSLVRRDGRGDDRVAPDDGGAVEHDDAVLVGDAGGQGGDRLVLRGRR